VFFNRYRDSPTNSLVVIPPFNDFLQKGIAVNKAGGESFSGGNGRGDLHGFDINICETGIRNWQ
jgi:hypothetical protein